MTGELDRLPTADKPDCDRVAGLSFYPFEATYRILRNGYGTFEIYRPDDTSILVSTKVEALEQEIGYWIGFDDSSLLWRVHNESRNEYSSLMKAVEAVTVSLHQNARQMIERARESERDRRIRELNEYLERLPIKEA